MLNERRAWVLKPGPASSGLDEAEVIRVIDKIKYVF